VSNHYRSKHYTNLRANTAVVASAAELEDIEETVAWGARRLFGVTEGTAVLETVLLWNTGDCSSCGGAHCDICFDKAWPASTTHCDMTTPPYQMHRVQNLPDQRSIGASPSVGAA
jgi:hypothetical protein